MIYLVFFTLNAQFIIFLNEVYKLVNIANIILCYFKKLMNLIQLKHSQIWMQFH